ncbi:MAG: EAL domain-containing protein [Bauldia sp.]|nr:EAL domain-containing protein [Bauldia sp.]
MTFAGLRSLINRYRVGLQDLSLVLAAMLVAAFVAFEFDIFADEGSASPRQQRIDLDEVLLLAGLLAVGLLGFAARRYFEQRREMRRRIAAERRARELAYKDPLTGVANRRQFDEALSAAAAALPRAGAVHAVMLLDLNGFKRVNDNYGHGVGDEALIIVAQRLLAAVRDGDLVARFGGDEFAIIALHLMGAQAAANIALRAIHALDEPVVVGDVAHQLGAGIGVALLPRDARTPGEALRMADVALYRAKVVRRSAMRFYEEDMDRLVHEREMMEQALRAALASGDIRPVFKPSVDLRTKAIVGMEAVPQWIHATLGEIPPERFLPIAEDAGVIHALAGALLRDACRVAVGWPDSVILSIDVYPVQLSDRDLEGRVIAILAEAGLPPRRLQIEITESALVADLGAARDTLGGLREAGVSIALDNFGTGYSSLYHLRNFKLDKIKIDPSFITAMTSEAESATIVGALVGLARGLGLTIAADGITGNDQRSSLLGTGCDEGQGSLFSNPLTAAAATKLVAERQIAGAIVDTAARTGG